jgi:hypothetical protein
MELSCMIDQMIVSESDIYMSVGRPNLNCLFIPSFEDVVLFFSSRTLFVSHIRTISLSSVASSYSMPLCVTCIFLFYILHYSVPHMKKGIYYLKYIEKFCKRHNRKKCSCNQYTDRDRAHVSYSYRATIIIISLFNE